MPSDANQCSSYTLNVLCSSRVMSQSIGSDAATPALPVSMSDVEAAMGRIRDHVHYTPVMTCSSLNSLSGLQLYFKCETFQKTGAFKVNWKRCMTWLMLVHDESDHLIQLCNPFFLL